MPPLAGERVDTKANWAQVTRERFHPESSRAMNVEVLESRWQHSHSILSVLLSGSSK